MRSDRDEYVKINWENIRYDPYGDIIMQFTRLPTHNLVQYNYGSVMQYTTRVCDVETEMPPTCHPETKITDTMYIIILVTIYYRNTLAYC